MLLAALVVLTGPVGAAVPAFSFSAARAEFGGALFEQLRIDFDGAKEIDAAFERMQGPGQDVIGTGVQIHGRLVSLDIQQGTLRASALVEAWNLAGELTLEHGAGALRVRWAARDQALPELTVLPGLPEPAAWVSGGRFDSEVALQWPSGAPPSLDVRLQVRDAVFDSPDGLFAGQGLGLALEGRWADLGVNELSLDGAVGPGELLLGDFYRDFGGAAMHYRATVLWNDHELRASKLLLEDDGAFRFEGRAGLQSASAAATAAPPGAGERAATPSAEPAWTLEADRLDLAFPEAYRRYIEPAAATLTLDGLEVTGRVVWSGEWQDGDLLRGDLQLQDLSVVDRERERFAATGVEAHLRPGDPMFASRLSWRGLLFGAINLGAGETVLEPAPGTIALARPLELEVLGGRVDLQTLRITLPGSRAEGAGEPDVRLHMDIDRVDMRQLSSALGWPEFAGTLSGVIPGVSLDDGVLTMDGEIRLDVFGGHIVLQQLGVERLFGVLPGLAADVVVDDLDLEQLTRTFSFGQIAGRLDGYVHDLRMLDWRPVAFDAWLGTPAEQSGSRDISRQAVNRLTTIGGGGTTTALTGPLMRMFSSFSYRRLGLGCRLQNNVCKLRGLSEDDSSVLLLEGAGVPKITIRAFNRSVDWPQMVSNLLAISADNPVQIGGAAEGAGN